MARRDDHRQASLRSGRRYATAVVYIRRMTKLITVVAFVFVAACGKKTVEDNILAEYAKAKDQLCACTDKACADGAKAFADTVEDRARTDIKKPTKELEQKFEKIEDQINECARKFQ
jgi:hypothetical protein